MLSVKFSTVRGVYVYTCRQSDWQAQIEELICDHGPIRCDAPDTRPKIIVSGRTLGDYEVGRGPHRLSLTARDILTRLGECDPLTISIIPNPELIRRIHGPNARR